MAQPCPEVVGRRVEVQLVDEVDHARRRGLGQHPEEVALVLEVPVEGAVADAGSCDDVVDPGVVVAPGGQHGRTGGEQPQSGLLAAGAQPGGRRRRARE